MHCAYRSFVMVDGLLQLYDLHVGNIGEQRNAADGCPAEDRSCGVSVPRKPHGVCGVNGACSGSVHGEARCICRPGWRGTSCDIRTFHLKYNSFTVLNYCASANSWRRRYCVFGRPSGCPCVRCRLIPVSRDAMKLSTNIRYVSGLC